MGAPPEEEGFRCSDPAPRDPGVRPLFLGMQAPSFPRPDSNFPFFLVPTSEASEPPLISRALKNLLTQNFEQILEVLRSDDLPVAREVGHGGGASGGPLRSFGWSTGR